VIEPVPAATARSGDAGGARVYPMAPLIRFTLLALYLALVLPLPLLAPAGLRLPLGLAVPLGLLPVLALTSERVELDHEGLRVGHPGWCSWWLRRGWALPWARITGLTPVRTSQGGRVYYVRAAADAEAGPSAWLLPQRVQHFEDFLTRFAEHTGLDTAEIGRISPPWTYRLLAALCAVLLAGELVTLIRTGSPLG